MNNTQMRMTMRDDFAVFILTHGRADNVATYGTLKKHGYTGKIYLLVDDTDKQIDDYKERYGNQVIVFSKQKAIEMTDSFDNFGLYKAIVYARNYSFIIAKELGLKYFLQLDDDYTLFKYTFDNNRIYITTKSKIKNLDRTFNAIVDFLAESSVDTVCMAQGGDFLGGRKNPGTNVMASLGASGKWSRKAMNSFFCITDNPIVFLGRINEDVNAYTSLGNTGKVFMSIPRLRIEQVQTQKSTGGMSSMYADVGTYVKSFYSVMGSPSSVTVEMMHSKHSRLHHKISWKHTVPQIISEDVKKRKAA